MFTQIRVIFYQSLYPEAGKAQIPLERTGLARISFLTLCLRCYVAKESLVRVISQSFRFLPIIRSLVSNSHSRHLSVKKALQHLKVHIKSCFLSSDRNLKFAQMHYVG